MKRKIVLILMCIFFAMPVAFAENINIDLKFNNESNSVQISGKAQAKKDNISFVLMVKDSEGNIVFTDQTKGTDVKEGISEFKFSDMPIGLSLKSGTYSFQVTGFQLGTSPEVEFVHADGSDMLSVMNEINNMEKGFVPYIIEKASLLKVEDTALKNINKTGESVFDELMKVKNYDLPKECSTKEDYEKIQKSLYDFRNDFAQISAIALFNDIDKPEMMKNWIDNNKILFSLDTDNENTKNVDEKELFIYAEKNKDKQAMSSGVINEPLKTKEDVIARFYEKALLASIETGHYSETQKIMNDFKYLIAYNEKGMKKLTSTQQIEVYTELKGHSYKDLKEFAKKADSLIAEKSKDKNKGSSSGGGGGGAPSKRPSLPADVTGVKPIDTNKKNTEFNDIKDVSWAHDAIEYLMNEGIVSGKGDGKFAPYDNITRAEFVKIVASAFDLENTGKSKKFSDVDDNAWYRDYVYAAAENGIVNGISQDTFAPDANITREDIATILFRALKIENDFSDIVFADKNEISPYATNAVAYLSKVKVINGMENNIFAPKAFATRAQVAKMVYEVIVKYLK